jgi:hypothetical protein
MISPFAAFYRRTMDKTLISILQSTTKILHHNIWGIKKSAMLPGSRQPYSLSLAQIAGKFYR